MIISRSITLSQTSRDGGREVVKHKLFAFVRTCFGSQSSGRQNKEDDKDNNDDDQDDYDNDSSDDGNLVTTTVVAYTVT